MHRLLLYVSDEAVAGLGADDVRQEERVEHHPLAHQDHEPEHRAGLLQLQEREQVHPLVLRLLQEGVDPAVVPVCARKNKQNVKRLAKRSARVAPPPLPPTPPPPPPPPSSPTP